MMANRVQNSLGALVHNKGTKLSIDEGKYVLDRTREYYIFDIIPTSAVRMTKSDTWKLDPNHIDPNRRQRPAVKKHFDFKTLLKLQSNQMGFVLTEKIDLVFIVPLPESYSAKKKASLNGMPCKKRPDIDNYIKLFCDSLSIEDGNIWSVKAVKVYGYKGSIIAFV